jgi:hypothetical protein
MTYTVGGGVLAHRTRCTYYGKYILNIFQNVKKVRQKILSIYLNNVCSSTKFCGEKIFFVTCVKKTKNGYVNNNVGAPKFVLEATKNVLFSRNFVNEHKIFRCTSRYFFQNFKHFKICFLVINESTLVSQSEFPRLPSYSTYDLIYMHAYVLTKT